MWFICVEVEQETSAPPAKKNPGSAPVDYILPCLNLIPQVHKLTEKAGVAMEPLLGTLFPSKATYFLWFTVRMIMKFTAYRKY